MLGLHRARCGARRALAPREVQRDAHPEAEEAVGAAVGGEVGRRLPGADQRLLHDGLRVDLGGEPPQRAAKRGLGARHPPGERVGVAGDDGRQVLVEIDGIAHGAHETCRLRPPFFAM